MQGGVKGYTTRILEYTRVEGLILRPAETVVRYGTLLSVYDQSQGKEFLAMVSNVKEETTHPAVDVERFRDLYTKIAESRLEEANRVLEELMSPSQDLVRWNSIMTVELRILGEVAEGGLTGYDRPPRPLSRIEEPEPGRLEEIIHAGLDGYEERGVYIGRLAAAPDVRIYLNMERFTMHLSILAQTGGGKTETVKRLVAETLWRKPRVKPRGGAVVFDIAGEYTGYPYLKPGASPLLDAVANPAAFGGPGESPVERFTVIVPYSDPGWRRLGQLRESLADLAVSLSGRTGLDWRVVLVERDRIVDGSGRRLDLADVAGLVDGARALVVGLPYPSFMSVAELAELAASRSEYFETIVDETASILGLMEGEDVLNVPAVYAAVKMAYTLSRQQRGPTSAMLAKVAELARAALEGRGPGRDEVKEAERRVRLLAYTTPYDYAAIAAAARYKAARDRLPEPEALEKLVNEDLKEALETLVGFYDSRTLASVQRGLKKVVLRTSSALGRELFDAIVERAVEGFTIVHLAPPSFGDVDMILGLLVRRAFAYHVGRYERDRLTLLVVEEAHNLAPPGEDKASKEALLRVAREGRKWGLSLWLVTQRPSFIDSSILSQTATSILLRTTNPEDLSTIRRGVESVAADVVERLPDLEPTRGEALVVGLAAPERRIPLLVMVDMLRRAGEGG